MRTLLIALLLFLWLVLGWLYYQDYNKCCTDNLSGTDAVRLEEQIGPILFDWDESIPILSNAWPLLKDSLTALISDTTLLEITGYYCSNNATEESNSTGFRRAAETRKLFTDVPDTQIILLSKQMDCDSTYGSQVFPATDFNIRRNSENIKEKDDRTLIYFPPNSNQKLNSDEVEKYLQDLAVRIKKSGEKVMITGFTDDSGSEDKNLMLGQRRADVIRNYLLSLGVAQDNVMASSKGESDPIADNTTLSGRAKNRRTELHIIK